MLTDFTKFTQLVGNHCDLNSNLLIQNSGCLYYLENRLPVKDKQQQSKFIIIQSKWDTYNLFRMVTITYFFYKIMFQLINLLLSLYLLLNSPMELFILFILFSVLFDL